MNALDFAQMFEDHYPAVLGYGLRRVDAATAHDVAAETFAIAWQRLDAPPEVPLPWLLAVARRVVANELRSHTRRDRLLERVALERTGTCGPSAGTGPGAGQGEEVLRALSSLSSPDQEVIRLIAWDELDHTAAAAVLGCSAVAFRVRLHRARRRLRAVLQRPPGPSRIHPAAAPEPGVGHSAAPQPTTPTRSS